MESTSPPARSFSEFLLAASRVEQLTLAYAEVLEEAKAEYGHSPVDLLRRRIAVSTWYLSGLAVFLGPYLLAGVRRGADAPTPGHRHHRIRQRRNHPGLADSLLDPLVEGVHEAVRSRVHDFALLASLRQDAGPAPEEFRRKVQEAAKALDGSPLERLGPRQHQELEKTLLTCLDPAERHEGLEIRFADRFEDTSFEVSRSYSKPYTGQAEDYPALTTRWTATIPRGWLMGVLHPGISAAEGRAVLAARSLPASSLPSDVSGWEAVWVRKGHGANAVLERGVVLKTESGTVSHTPNLRTDVPFGPTVAGLRRREALRLSGRAKTPVPKDPLRVKERSRQAEAGRLLSPPSWIQAPVEADLLQT